MYRIEVTKEYRTGMVRTITTGSHHRYKRKAYKAITERTKEWMGVFEAEKVGNIHRDGYVSVYTPACGPVHCRTYRVVKV